MRRAPYIWALLAIGLGIYFGFRKFDRNDAGQASSETSVLMGETMGTTYSIRIADQITSGELQKLDSAISEELKTVNDQMSTYQDDSELSRFNRSQTLDWFPVSSHTAEVVALAKVISDQSDGGFDVTVGPLVEAWGFGPKARSADPPGEQQLAELQKVVGTDLLMVRETPPALKKSVAALHVDLSAIAKGHGVDRVAAVLQEHDIKNYFVEIGGEVVTAGNRADGDAWRIGIEAPVSGTREAGLVVEMSNAAMATSGDYRNYFEDDGVRYSHTIDPKTGRPITHNLASVSVVADNCALADGWATALNVAGPDQGMKLANEHSLAILMIVREAGQFQQIASPEFETRFPNWQRKRTN